ncbi:hypothetical protein SprV_0100122600 [Sparganum proliferum]
MIVIVIYPGDSNMNYNERGRRSKWLAKSERGKIGGQGNRLVAWWVEAWTSKPTGREFEARVFHIGLGYGWLTTANKPEMAILVSLVFVGNTILPISGFFGVRKTHAFFFLFSSSSPPQHSPDWWVSPLTLAAWNVRSLLDNPRSNQPQRRTALVARELVRYKVDIAALGSPNKANWRKWVPATLSSGAVAPRESHGTQVSPPPSGTTSWNDCPVCRRASAIVWNLHRTPPHPDEHLLPADAKDGYLEASSVASVTPAEQCLRPDARSLGLAGDKGDPPVPTGGPTIVSSAPRCGFLYSLTGDLKRDTVQSTALAVHQHQRWFDDNEAAIAKLLAGKNRLHKAYVDRPADDNRAGPYRSRRHVKLRLREMQDAWTARKAEGIEGYANRNEWKNFLSAIETVYGPPTKATEPLLSAEGTILLTKKTQTLQRWAEHFRGVLNRTSTISDTAIAVFRKWRPKSNSTSRDFSTPRNHPGRAAALQRKSSRIGRDPRIDLQSRWLSTRGASGSAIPGDVAPRRGPTGFQGRYNLASIQTERKPSALRQPPRHLLAQHHRENLCSHPSHPPEQPPRKTSPAGKPVRLPPSSWDHGHDLCHPPTSGEVPGDAASPAIYPRGPDKSLRYGESRRTVENHAEIRLSRMIHSDVHELLFSAACENFGLVISTEKTVVMHQPPPNKAPPPNAPQISVNGTQPQVVDNFPYLGSTLSQGPKIASEVARRISNAIQAFRRL